MGKPIGFRCFTQASSGGRLPLILETESTGAGILNLIQIHRPEIMDRLDQNGAILFRGYNVTDPNLLSHIVQALGLKSLSYQYRSTPRHEIAHDVYTASEYPAKHSIPMHCENAYQKDWPTRILFACARPSEIGGQTPLADMTAVTRRLSEECFRTFAERGVSYVRNYHDGIDLGWQEVFQTEDRDVVGEICRDMGIEYDWVDGERLRTRQTAQGVARHHTLDQLILFNQATLFHVSALGADVAASMIETFGYDDLPRNAYFGDGGEIPSRYLDEVRAAFEAEKVLFDWQKGDFVLIDNMQVAHGREPFAGQRLILACLCDPYSESASAHVRKAQSN